MNMMLLEIFIIAGVIFYVVWYALKEPKPIVFLEKFFFCATAAWISEETSIILYGFYDYNSVWNLCIADVPLVVVIVWPALIHSATVVASNLLAQNSRLLPLIAGCIVLTDAMLIEPVSVNFNLWRWHQPGLFGVPLIGLLGWAYFAFFSVAFFVPIDLLKGINLKIPIVMVVSVIGTHLLLLITYWTFFRWTIRPLNPADGAGFIWIASAILSIFILVKRIGCRIELKTLLIRLPAAIFFYILLFVKQKSPMTLMVYSFAFILPYAVVLIRSICSDYSICSNKTLTFQKK